VLNDGFSVKFDDRGFLLLPDLAQRRSILVESIKKKEKFPFQMKLHFTSAKKTFFFQNDCIWDGYVIGCGHYYHLPHTNKLLHTMHNNNFSVANRSWSSVSQRISQTISILFKQKALLKSACFESIWLASDV
jgi:hypothetical protein